MATVVIINQGGQGPTRWRNEFCDCFADCNTCCYVAFCTYCAAGDVAVEAGENYFCSCALPILMVGLGYVPIHCCVWGNDRRSLARRFGVHDPHCTECPCFLFLFCSTCALCQEINHIKANGGFMGERRAPPPMLVLQQPPQQMVMGGYPQQYPQQYPQGQYPPQQGYPGAYPGAYGAPPSYGAPMAYPPQGSQYPQPIKQV